MENVFEDYKAYMDSLIKKDKKVENPLILNRQKMSDSEWNEYITKKSGYDRNILFFVLTSDIDFILNNSELDINMVDCFNENILFYCNVEQAKIFLEKGINVNQINNSGENALFSSITSDVEKIKILISAGIDINHKDDKNRSFLFYADEEKTKILLENNADVNIIDIFGNTAIFHAEFDKIKLLVEKGVNVNQINEDGVSALFFKDKHTQEYLFSKGALPVRVDNDKELTEESNKLLELFASMEKNKIESLVDSEKLIEKINKNKRI